MIKLNKKDFVFKLMEKGYTEKTAGIIYDDFSNIISESLLDGKSVAMNGVGVFISEVLPAGSIKLFGEEKKVDKRLKISFKVSRTLLNKFKATRTNKAVKVDVLKNFRKNLHN